MTPITFAPAVRENVGVLIALAGASGSGKTFSALRLAKGLAGGKPIAFIDTEARRGLHYADQFDFLHADLRPPFHPDRFVQAIHAAEQAGAAVVIVDSMSHEHDGEGGIIDMAALLEAGQPKPGIEHPRDPFQGDGWKDWLVKPVKPPGNWKEPKASHKRMMNALLQCRASLIFCLRADEKIEIIKEGGRTQVRPLGWMPICEKRFMYEMTASFTLTPDAPGRPRFDLPHKLQAQHRPFFRDDGFIGEDAGRALAEWARGGAAPPLAQQQATQAPGKTFTLVDVGGPPFPRTKGGVIEALDVLAGFDTNVIMSNRDWLVDMAAKLPDLADRIQPLLARCEATTNPPADDGWPGPQ